MPDGSTTFENPLDRLIARATARAWSFADAVAALRRCGNCEWHSASFPGRCTAHDLWRRAGDGACTDYEHSPDDADDYRDDIGVGDVGSAGR